MDNNSGFSQDIEKLSEYQELNELRRLLNLKGITSEAAIITTWFSLMKMKEELGLPSLHPIKEHYYFYQSLVEIYKIFNLSSMDFIQLNQLYILDTTKNSNKQAPLAYTFSHRHAQPLLSHSF